MARVLGNNNLNIIMEDFYYIYIYQIIDTKSTMFCSYRGNKNVTLTLSWNIIPNAGLLPSVNALGSHTFAFPSEYTTLRV